MHSKTSVAASALALAAQLSGVSASTCFNFGVGPFGACNVDPNAPERFQAYLNFDDSLTSCNAGGEFDMALVYTDNQGNARSVEAIAAATVADAASQVATVNFNVPLTSIQTAVPVTLMVTGYNSNLQEPFTTSVLYTQAATPTVSYLTSTATNYQYTTTATVTTTTVTGNRVSTTFPGFLRESTQQGGKQTVTVQPFSTITSTIVPTPITITKYTAGAAVTSTFSCNPQQTVAPFRRMKRAFFDETASAPFCGVPTTTFVVNHVATTSAVATITQTNTVMISTHSISTSTASIAKTKYVNPTGTTTLSLPTVTLTAWTKAVRQTHISTSTRVATKWVGPGKVVGAGACKPAMTYSLSASAAVSTSI
ncbi:hypothetical protein ANO11243_094650 [Dothideomycetidae sp. 11243]|nr:hypothetical protein ANO11243_094650 [fungal sp. No.11243]